MELGNRKAQNSKEMLTYEQKKGNSKIQMKDNQDLISVRNQIEKFENKVLVQNKTEEKSFFEENIISFESTVIYLLITFLILFGKYIIDRWVSKRKKMITFSNNPLVLEMDEVSVPEINLSDIEKEKKLYEIAKNESNVFFNVYIKTYPKFYRILSDKLIDSEIEICAFTKLNFDTKHIARLKDVSVRSVEGKKYRIRKKLHIDPSMELADWLRNNA